MHPNLSSLEARQEEEKRVPPRILPTPLPRRTRRRELHRVRRDLPLPRCNVRNRYTAPPDTVTGDFLDEPLHAVPPGDPARPPGDPRWSGRRAARRPHPRRGDPRGWYGRRAARQPHPRWEVHDRTGARNSALAQGSLPGLGYASPCTHAQPCVGARVRAVTSQITALSSANTGTKCLSGSQSRLLYGEFGSGIHTMRSRGRARYGRAGPNGGSCVWDGPKRAFAGNPR